MAIFGPADSGTYTKADADRKRELAKQLMGSTFRAKNPLGALAMALEGGVSGAYDKEASGAEAAGNKQIAELLAGKDYTGVMGNEWANPQQAALASMLQGRDWQQQDQAANWAREDAAAAKPSYGFDFAPDGSLIRTDKSSGTFEDMGDFGKPPEPAAPIDFGDIAGMRKEVQGLPSYKNLAQATPIYNSMVETAGRDSRASDLNLVYGLGKIMDPTSVVREGEMFMVQGINTLPDKLVEGINSVLTGSSTLSPATREAILKEAYGRMKGYEDAFGADSASYTDLAGRYNINPQDVLPAFKPTSPWSPPPPPAAGGDDIDAILGGYGL